MTEMLEGGETRSTELRGLLAQWVESPPASISAALSDHGLDAAALEEYARGGLSLEEAESLRRLVIQSAAAGGAEDAALLARLTPVLDPRERAWDRLIRARAAGEILTATVIEATRGGVLVDLGVRGFVPTSQLGLSIPRNLATFVGRALRLRVMEVDRRRQTVVLSNRQILEEERAQQRKAALARLEEGQERAGVVRRLTDIGAFVDVGGVDGLLHISEISWKRINHPSDTLTVGQKVQVKVLRVDPGAGRVSLSMRRLSPDPWEEARRRYGVGSIAPVTVVRLVPQGAIVRLDDDIEGFIPIGEMANRRINSPEEVLQAGQEVEALVIDLTARERRIVLSLKKLEQRRERPEPVPAQKRPRAPERTTLGDLFGHLFRDMLEAAPEPEPGEPSAAATAAPRPHGSDATEAPQAAVNGAAATPPALAPKPRTRRGPKRGLAAGEPQVPASADSVTAEAGGGADGAADAAPKRRARRAPKTAAMVEGGAEQGTDAEGDGAGGAGALEKTAGMEGRERRRRGEVILDNQSA